MKITCVLYKSLQSVRAAALIGAAMGGVLGKGQGTSSTTALKREQSKRK